MDRDEFQSQISLKGDTSIYGDNANSMRGSVLDNVHKETLLGPQVNSTTLQDQEECLDLVGEFSLPHQPRETMDLSQLSVNEKPNRSRDMAEEVLQVPVPTHSTGITTFAYQRALRNRIRGGKLARHGDYDTRAFTPTFVHDCLQLPGSLANVLGKSNLIGPKGYAHGMLIFGEGREGRDQIHRHYRPHAKRIKVQVEYEVVVPVQAGDRQHPRERWVLKRKRQWAHAWLWSNTMDLEMQFRMDLKGWKLEDYLAGRYALHGALKIVPGLREDYEGDLSSDEDVEGNAWKDGEERFNKILREPTPESREIIYGGFGTLDYERSADAIGKW